MAEVYDGFVSLLDGMDSLTEAALIPASAYSRGINVSCRGGFIHTRPGFTKLVDLPVGKFQGAAVWSLNSEDRVVFVVDGQPYVLSLSTFQITKAQTGVVVVPSEDEAAEPISTTVPTEMSATVDRCFFTQPDRWMLLQDGVSKPLVLQENEDGSVSAYGREAPEVCYVPGTVSFYLHQRVHYAPALLPAMSPAIEEDEEDATNNYDVAPDLTEESGRMVFVSSDIRDNYDPQWVFRMSEHRVLNEGGGLALPQELGFITAMSAMRNAATGTGLGALIVFAREGLCAFDVSKPRSQWLATSENGGIGQPLFRGPGTKSPYSPLQVNDDLVYVDTLGHLRALRYDSSNLAGGSGSLSCVPLSAAAEYYVRMSPESLLPLVSTAFVNNRVFWTLCGEGDYFKALGVLDTAQVSGFGSASDAPSFDGVWTGFKFQQILAARIAGRTQLLVVVKTGELGNAIYVLDEDATTDSGTPIEAQLYSRMMDFGAPVDLKQLLYAEAWLQDMPVTTTVSVYFRSSGFPVWSPMDTKVFSVPEGSLWQARRKVRFGLAPNLISYNTVTQEKLFNGNDFQFCIKWTGACKISKFRAVAEAKPEAAPACEVPVGTITDNGLLSDFSYAVLSESVTA